MLQATRNNVAWRAIPIAGITAGFAFLLVSIVSYSMFSDIDPFFILNYFASLIVGGEALINPSLTTQVIGIAVHFALSMLFTFVIAVSIHRWGLIVGIIGGGILGLSFYGINFYTMTVFFDWMFTLSGTIMVASHIIFGMVAGGVYEMLDDYDESLFEEGS